jgi:hypothetical protein
MFFEVMNSDTGRGEIGLATSGDGLRWTYKQIVLREPFHLSYPYVFEWKNQYYMVPEAAQSYSVRLYKAVDFPRKWSLVGRLLEGASCMDPSVLFFDHRWWLFTASAGNDVLHLFYADELRGPWVEHPESPIVRGNAHMARPGGRVLVFDNRVVRYAQEDIPVYGHQVRAFEITKLTTTDYKERETTESPVLKPGGDRWNADRMHTIDPHQIGKKRWMACVDGARVYLRVTREMRARPQQE